MMRRFLKCYEQKREIRTHDCEVIRTPLLKGTAGKLKRNLEDSNKLESEGLIDGIPVQPSM